MRILAIGLGGAGCRIVNSLYTTDRRSSKVVCVEALAIDVHADTFAQMGGLPDNAKLFFPPVDTDLQINETGDTQTATIDIGEIVARIQNIEIGETDAIFVCCGLGGSMVDVAPHIIAALRSSITEPIFGLVTLPCLAEGERRSAKAADDIDMLTPLLDGIILFDNETWYKKIKALKSTLVKKEKGLAEKLGFRKSEPELSPELKTYLLLNEAIVRRISLILRAGEFKADGGLDFAEVVLDSGEVLNTMKGMGYITIGYAVERLPHNPLGFLTSFRPAVFFADEHTKKASRIVDLAKQAIYHEISTPCDMTSAHKALILIAGPSHELSLKGFMTVRKWIDRSIAGLETRSGDYPVMNTKNVAIIIMLSGLENIPRITELKEIQVQYKTKHQDSAGKQSDSDASWSGGSAISSENQAAFTGREKGTFQQEALVLQGAPYKKEKSSWRDSIQISHPDEEITPEPESPAEIKPAPHIITQPHSVEAAILPLPADEAGIKKSTGSLVSQHRVVAADDHDNKLTQSAARISSHVSQGPRIPQIKKSSESIGLRGLDEKHLPHNIDGRLKPKEIERQIIEKELQRQRMMAISGRTPKTGPEVSKHRTHPHEIIRLKRDVQDRTILTRDDEQPDLAEEPQQVPKKRRIIIQKKTVHSVKEDTQINKTENKDAFNEDELSVIKRPAGNSRQIDSEELKVRTKHSAYKSKDHIFGGKGIQKTAPPQVKDSVLIHTDLKSKKSIGESKNVENTPEGGDNVTESSNAPAKKEKNTLKKDDFNWI
ncbi:MAG: tubulin/FtsZ family protein [Methanoregula sp.]|jgi:cell division GTPase FtsZ|nr:tubulin/FtsZ family protein [Methanoregula sp.]